MELFDNDKWDITGEFLVSQLGIRIIKKKTHSKLRIESRDGEVLVIRQFCRSSIYFSVSGFLTGHLK